MQKSGAIGLILTGIGIILLLFTFSLGYQTFMIYSDIRVAGVEEVMRLLLLSAVKALFLGVMAWVGGIFLVRGVEFMKVERGIGVVTFKVEKGVGVAKVSEEAFREEK
jgi:hypothetical protein